MNHGMWTMSTKKHQIKKSGFLAPRQPAKKQRSAGAFIRIPQKKLSRKAAEPPEGQARTTSKNEN
jgi:hypothetical protein